MRTEMTAETTQTTGRPISSEDPDSIPTVASYTATDRGTPPSLMLSPGGGDLGNAPISKERFFSREWADLEDRLMWRRVWQLACRENDIPEVGDQIAYDIVGQSVIVVRSAPDRIRAFHNVCRHRGTQLVVGAKQSEQIKCPYHGWSWNLDGSLKQVVCRWDFPELRDEDYGLSEVKVGTWNGFVFINLDPDCDPLEEFLGEEILAQWEQFPTRTRFWKAGHVGKVIGCNWKVALEGFIEAYHGPHTHPQTTSYISAIGSQADYFGPHGRVVTTFGAPDPLLGGTVDPQETVDGILAGPFASLLGDKVADVPPLAEGQNPRHLVSDIARSILTEMTGRDLRDPATVSDTEILDTAVYNFFPNMVPWGTYAFPGTNRVRPNGNDRDSCIWEIMVLVPLPDGVPMPPDTPLRMTPPDEKWAEIPEIGGLGPITDQDHDNLERVQRGLHMDGTPHVLYSNNQERNIRNFHRVLEQYLGVQATQRGLPG